ncbi:MAG: NTP transferase domain-containing protein [Verrucomicrobiales bacterium]|nr:NTP transferase domain-containing protein [Verrucomicrobiales bacterium]
MRPESSNIGECDLPAGVILARSSSQRLPGKVLMPIAGQPMVRYVIEKLQHCPVVGRICLATSTDKSDDELARYCEQEGIVCIRGPLENVAARALIAAEHMGAQCFFRVNGDSPLLGSELLIEAWDIYRQNSPDLVTNIFPRTFPPGASVELIRTSAMQKAVASMIDPDDKEHVTKFFYRHSEQYHIENLLSNQAYGEIHLAVDCKEDFSVLSKVIARMNRPHWEYRLSETVNLLSEVGANG